ncbi:MAG: hypothetical protein LBV39_03320 [Bacteroidales bacterium]|nr:hypothetical protein [Bacteroidales bacterium]
MTYRFRQNEEPTDEQLNQLMREVGEEARKSKARGDENLRLLILKECELAEERANILPNKEKTVLLTEKVLSLKQLCRPRQSMGYYRDVGEITC